MRHTPRRVLADNLTSLMAYHRDLGHALGTIDGVSASSKVPRGTVHRIKQAEVSVGVDHLEGLSRAFDLEVWQLFVPHIEPSNPPMLAAVSDKQMALLEKIKQYAKDINNLG